MTSLKELEHFRKQAYLWLGNGRDALFDLMDAVLCTRSLSSFAELSLSPVFRRQWPSLYEGLQDGRPNCEALMAQYISQISESEPVILVGDHTAWSRPHAKTLRERTYEHQAQSLSGCKPVTLGHGYSTLAWVPTAQQCWALPLRHERITSFETPLQKAATQLRRGCEHLKRPVLFIADSEYGSASFLRHSAAIRCAKLLRLRPNRVLYRSAAPYQGRGRPPQHGAKFALKDADTWSSPQADVFIDDLKLGALRLRRWSALHCK
jgi:hypothetical protein